jgi:transposase-like protein
MTSVKQTASYPPEFRAEAVRLVCTSRKPYRQIACDLGTTTETLRKWPGASRSGRRQTPGWPEQ